MDMIGNLLASERKKKGLEIIDVEHTTGIRAAYLLALEEAVIRRCLATYM